MADRILDDLRTRLTSIPRLRSWEVNVFRDAKGHLGAVLSHKLGQINLVPSTVDNLAARDEILFGIEHSVEIPILNRAPDVGDPRLVRNLRSGLTIHDWSFAEYCQVLGVMRDAGRLTYAEMDWLIASGRLSAESWPGRNQTRQQNINSEWGQDQVAPWQLKNNVDTAMSSARTPVAASSSGHDEEMHRLEVRVAALPSMAMGWSVRITRVGVGVGAVELHHALLGRRPIQLTLDLQSIDTAFREIRRQLAHNQEVSLIGAAGSVSDPELLGALRESASKLDWRPSFYFQVLQVLNRARILSRQNLVWAMEAGPAGDPHWKRNEAHSREYAKWRIEDMPRWSPARNHRINVRRSTRRSRDAL